MTVSTCYLSRWGVELPRSRFVHRVQFFFFFFLRAARSVASWARPDLWIDHWAVAISPSFSSLPGPRLAKTNFRPESSSFRGMLKNLVRYVAELLLATLLDLIPRSGSRSLAGVVPRCRECHPGPSNWSRLEGSLDGCDRGVS